jgi:HAD superfamily hydrolase (TIGR01509 family)
MGADAAMTSLQALIFDCDGVLVDTERDGHRIAFNQAFVDVGLQVEWDVALYGRLLDVAGGKERMRQYFDHSGWPEQATHREDWLREMHRRKTERFMEVIEAGRLPLRPGVARLIDEAIENKIVLAICSTSNERAVTLVVERLLGRERKNHFDAILAGDVVSQKKPDPEIYHLAAERLHLAPRRCVVIEDSRNGFLAARAAGMRCVITTNGYTENEDFTGADRVVTALGDPPHVKISIDTLNEVIAGLSLEREH